MSFPLATYVLSPPLVQLMGMEFGRVWWSEVEHLPCRVKRFQAVRVSLVEFGGAPDRIRTCGLCLRRAKRTGRAHRIGLRCTDRRA